MFDGAAAVDVAHAATDAAAPAAAEHMVDTETALRHALTAEAQRATEASPATTQRQEVVFVDSNVRNYQQLVSGLKPGTEVVVLDANKDGLQQIADYLDGRSGIDAIHILSHGDVGKIQLGNDWLDGGDMAARSELLDAIGQSLAKDGDILVYGCRVGADGVGNEFVQALANATGADVAASDDMTGAAVLGGDWTLERNLGTVETSALLGLETYNGLLATPADQNFDALPLAGQGSNSVTIGGVTYFNNDSIPISIVNDGFIAGGADHVLAYRSTGPNTSTEVGFKTQDSSEFKLNSFVVDRGFGGDNTFSIKGYRNGVLIDTKVVDVSSGTATFNVSADSKWEYIDEVRITGADLDVDIDDINFSDAVIPDTTPPTVTSVSSSTANGTYKAGDVISVTVTFSEVVTVTGTPQLTLETGAIDRVINYSSGSGTSTLTFNYTVQAGDTNADLDYLSTGALALNGGSIRDAAANNATLTLASPGTAGSLGANKSIVIDSAPSISNVNGDSVAWAGVGNTVTLDSGSNAVFSDIEKGALNSGNGNWAGGSLTVQRSGTAVSADTFGFDTTGALFTVSGSNLQSGGQTFATFTSTGGVLTITFTSSGTAATTALINNVAQRVTYRSDTPAGDATVRFTLSDGTSSATANTTVTSDTIYITNTTDTATINASDGVSISEAVAIAAADATGSQTLIFGSNFNTTVSLAGSLSINESLTLNADSASGLTISGGNTITLGGGTTLDFTNSTGSVTIGATLGGSGSLSKAGGGTLILSSVSNEANMSGGITVTGGTLQVQSDDHLSSGTLTLNGGTLTNNASAMTIDNAIVLGAAGGTFNIGGGAGATTVVLSGTISGSGSLTKNGQAILELSGNNTYTGATNVTGTLIASHANALGTTAGSTTVANGATVRLGGGLTVAESFNITGSGKTVAATNYGALHLGSGSTTVSGTVTLTGAADISAVSGSTLTISGAMSGAFALNKTDAGTLVLSNSGNEAGLTAGTTITFGTLSIANDDYLSAGTITLNGGTLAITGATTVDNAIALTAASTISNSASATLSGVLSGSGTLTKSGASTLTLSGSNTHSGAVNLTAGGLTLSGGSALGNTSAVTQSASTVLTISTAETIGSLAGTGSVVLNAGLTTGSDNTSTTYSGVISGTSGFTKAGSGTQTLTGNNTYTGTTNVSAGGLTLNRAGGALDDNTSVAVAAGATLTVSADETIDALSGAGTVALGASALTVGINGTSSTFSGAVTGSGTLVLDGGGTFTLSGTNSGQSWGLQVLSGGTVAIAGDANLGSGTVQLNDGTLSVTSTGTIDNAITLGASAGRVSVDSGLALRLSGAIGGAGALTKTGSGTLTLSGGNNYSGTTTVSSGTLSVAGDGNLGAGTVVLAAGSTLQVTGATTIDNAFNLGGAATFQADAAVTVSGAIGGSGSLTKAGAGTLTLSSASSNYSGGTTLAAGTVSVRTSAALGGGTITFNGGALDVSTTTALAFSNAVNMATAGSISFMEDAEATFSGAFSGSGGLTVTGVAGGSREVLTLSNSGNSTIWSGTMTANDATLQVAADSMLSSGSITINDGSVLLTTATTAIDNDVAIGGAGILYSNSGALVLSGVLSGSGALTTGGTVGTSVTLAGSNTHNGSVTVAAGKLILSGGSAVSDSSAVTVSNASTLELASNETIGSLAGTAGTILTLGSNTLTTGGNNSSTFFAGAIGGTGSLIKTGSGTQTLSGSNTFTGGVQVSAGGLTASGGAAISNSASVNVDSGATFNLSANETIGALSGAGTVQLGSSTLSTGGSNLSTTFSGAINGSGNLIKNGTGTLTLSGSNGYTGTTTVGGGGTLSITDAGNISANTLGLNNGGTLEVAGSNVTLTNTIVLDTGGGRISNAHGLTLSGVLTNTNSFTKLGAGTLTLTGTSNYAGATNVNAGTLLVNGALVGTSSLTVAAGATLGGSGSIFANSSTNTLSVQSGGVLSPGNSAGTLTVNGNLQMNAGSVLAVEINGTTAGTQYDQVVVNGTADISGATLAVTHGYTPGLGDTYTLIDNNLSDGVTGNFSGLAEGATLTAGGNSTELTVSYVGGTGNDFTLTAPTNSAPVVTDLDGDSTPYTAGTTVVLDAGGNAVVSDAQDDLANWNGGSLVVQRYTGGSADPSANDLFGFDLSTAAFSVSGTTFSGDLQFAGLTFATYNYVGGVLTITFTGSSLPASTGLVQDVVRHINYNNATPYGDANIRFALTDSLGGTVNSDVTLTCDTIYVDQSNDDAGGDAADGFSLREALARGAAQGGADTIRVILADNSTITLGSGVISGAGDTLDLDGANGLTITGSTITLGGAFTLNNGLTDTATIASTLAGSATLTKTGAGTLTLTSTGNEAGYSGAIALNGGTLAVGNDDALGSGALQFDGGTFDVTAGGVTVDNAMAFGSGGGTLNANVDWTASGVFSGNGTLSKTGIFGTLTLSGASAHTGTTTLGEGILAVGGDSNLGSGLVSVYGGTFSVNTTGQTIDNAFDITSRSGAIELGFGIEATLSGLITGTGDFFKSGSGTLNLTNTGNSSSNWTFGQINGTTVVTSADQIGGGILKLAGGTLAVNTNSTFTLNRTTQVISTVALDATGSGTGVVISLGGAMSGSGAFSLNAGDSQIYLSNASNLTGPLTLSSTGSTGLVAAIGSGTLGSGTINLTAGSTLGVAGSSRTFSNDIVLQGDATLRTGSPATGADNITFSGVISESGGARNLTVNGYSVAGNHTDLVLAGNNTYTGTTTLVGGTLKVASDANLGGGDLVLAGGTLAIGGATTIDNNVNVSGGATIRTDAATTLSGVISGGATLTKSGSETLTLTGTETHNGTTHVSAGTLAVNGSTAGATTVGSGATLAGIGTLGGAVTVQSGGTLAPGGNAAGILTINGPLSMAAGSTLALQINGLVAGSGHDQIVVNGAVDVSGATLAVTHGYAPGEGDACTIIDNDLADGVTGNFSGLPEDGIQASAGNGTVLTASYIGGTGNDVTLTAPIFPRVTGVTSSNGNGQYGIGDAITITVTFDANVSVTGTPQLLLETGTTDRTLNYVSGSGSNTLTFSYTVQAGDVAADLDYAATTALTLNGGTIKGAASQDAILTLAAPGAAGSLGANKALVVDGVRPSASISLSDSSLTVGESATVTITFSEAVTGFSLADLTAGNGTLSNLTTSDNIHWTATLTPNAGNTSNGNYVLLDNSLYTDASGNTGAGVALSNLYAVDTLRPTATIVVADTALAVGETSTVTITFSEAITGLTTADFTVASGTLSNLSSSDGGITWTATLTPTANSVSAGNLITLDATGYTDAAGNSGANTTTSNAYAIDTLRPTATIMVADTALAVGETSTVTITFSEAVNDFTNADLSVSGGTLSTVSSSDGGVTWTATFTPTANQESTVNLITLNNAGVTDKAGNAGVGSTGSNAYAIDTLRPTATITVADTALAVGETSTVTITFSEAVNDFTNADLSVSGGTLSAVSSSDGGITWTATFTPTANITATSNLITLNNAGVTDKAGNAGVGSTDSNNYAIDTLRPTATITVADTALAVGETSTVTITFSEAVTGLDIGDFTVANGVLSNLSSSDGGITWTAILTPTASVTDTTNVIALDNTGYVDAA
ncbi:Ig-like domain-containing protein, partial [Comamonas testosteroni]